MYSAIQKLKTLLGEAFVKQGDDVVPYTMCTSGSSRKIEAVVLPENVEQVQAIVRIANEHNIPLYPISSGKNWGYGTTNPVVDSCVIVELSRMNRILAFDETLGVVTVEPGVTQGQLYSYLQQRDLPFYVPITGSSPDCSLLGNALERGFGITPIADHFLGINDIQAVLPDGTLFRSLMVEMGGENSSHAYKWGLGPYVEGLFTQGNAGIVTQATIELAAKHEGLLTFLFRIADKGSLLELIESSRKLQRESGLTFSNIKFFNSRYLMAMRNVRPHDSAMTQEELNAVEASQGLDVWTGVGGVYGDPSMLGVAKKIITRHLKPHSKQLVFFGKKKLQLVRLAKPFLPSALRQHIQGLFTLVNYQKGVPTDAGLKTAYWRSGKINKGKSLDPARDGCGVMWYVPVMPFTKETVDTYIEIVETTCKEFGIEPVINITARTSICLYSLVMIFFDKSTQQEAANSCRRALVERTRDQLGILPYRMNVDEIAEYIKKPHGRFYETIKTAIDPKNIIAPGRYTAG